MADKATLMTGDVKEFLASMNPKPVKKKVAPNCRSVKRHHANGR